VRYARRRSNCSPCGCAHRGTGQSASGGRRPLSAVITIAGSQRAPIASSERSGPHQATGLDHRRSTGESRLSPDAGSGDHGHHSGHPQGRRAITSHADEAPLTASAWAARHDPKSIGAQADLVRSN
jgi:hypothetical protein